MLYVAERCEAVARQRDEVMRPKLDSLLHGVKDGDDRLMAMSAKRWQIERLGARMTRPASAACVAALLAASGCGDGASPVNRSAIQPMRGAVWHSDTDEVRRLARLHVGLEERDPAVGSTPIVDAAQTDQWPVVEILMAHGADVWAHDRFGITVAQDASTSRILRGSPEDAARLRVIAALRARGLPWPPPSPEDVLALERRGAWPPRAR